MNFSRIPQSISIRNSKTFGALALSLFLVLKADSSLFAQSNSDDIRVNVGVVLNPRTGGIYFTTPNDSTVIINATGPTTEGINSLTQMLKIISTTTNTAIKQSGNEIANGLKYEIANGTNYIAKETQKTLSVESSKMNDSLQLELKKFLESKDVQETLEKTCFKFKTDIYYNLAGMFFFVSMGIMGILTGIKYLRSK